MDPLKLVALDREDMEVVSAHLQDAVIKASDIHWRPAEKRVVVGLNRFNWEAANGSEPQFCRCRAALRFERVLACKCRNVDAAAKDQTLNLLAISFDEQNPPGGAVILTFSGGAALRLDKKSDRRDAQRPADESVEGGLERLAHEVARLVRHRAGERQMELEFLEDIGVSPCR